MERYEGVPAVTGGCGSVAVLATMILIALQLTGVIYWPWWLVISPILLDVALSTLAMLFIAGISIWSCKDCKKEE
jgi:NO-binding membrane sensor protein with MHYT domain